MNYELAKKLKDAGFPQGKNGNFSISVSSSIPVDSELPYIPTLSELIEACVKLSATGDFHLEHNSVSKRHSAGWGASVDCFKGNEYIDGKTPEEAIARLWLSLHNPVI